jgi:endonuclease I
MKKPATMLYGLIIVFIQSICIPVVASEGEQEQITLSVDQLHHFREVYAGMRSDVQFYEVSVDAATEQLLISTGEPFAISLDCYSGFNDSVVVTPSGGNITTTRIYVRFSPETIGEVSRLITHAYPGATPRLLELHGTGITSQIPENYYSAAISTGSKLKTELFGIIQNHSIQSSSSIWSHFETTDATFSGHVWDIYSDIPCENPPYLYTFVDDQDRGTGGNAENQFFNREHGLPLSWFGGQVSPMATDLHHIYPVDKSVNALRANYPYGLVNNANKITMNGSKSGNNSIQGYSGRAFEPVDGYKGDLARSFFYMITRYEDQVESWTYSPEGNEVLDHTTWPGFRIWAVNMFRHWHEQDPVSQKEIIRNNALYQIQGNRNPFIDHPEFVERIWGNDFTNTEQAFTSDLLKIYPNPARQSFSIDAPAGSMHVKVLNLHQKVIATAMGVSPHASIVTGDAAPGIYLVEILTGNTVYHKKLIIY